MRIHPVLIMWQLILPILMPLSVLVASAEDVTNQEVQSESTETISAREPPTTTSNDFLAFIDYFATETFHLFSSLAEYNITFLSGLLETIQTNTQQSMSKLYSTLFSPSRSLAHFEVKNDLLRIRWPAFTYRLYELQTILLRIETIAIFCIIFIVTLFIHSYRERQKALERHLSYSASSTAIPATVTTDHLFAKLFRCINLTILFTSLFALIDSITKSFRTNETYTIQVSHADAAVYAMRGRRPNMEDCFSMKNTIAKDLGIDYYAVYDGHGGPNAALFAEKEVFEAIIKRVQSLINETKSTTTANDSSDNHPDSCPPVATSSPKKCPAKFDSITVTSMKNILSEEMINVDQRLVEKFQINSDISGTTALVAVKIVHLNTLLVANVGDSRAIMCDWKGATIPLSFDHKPYQFKEYRRIVEAGGYITLRGVYRVNGILAVSRALGDYPLKEGRLVIPDPDILAFDLNELKPRFMIMASDGFWDTFSNDNATLFVKMELLRFAKNGKCPPSTIALAIAKKLANEAFARESYDNITVIVILFDDDGKSTFARASPTTTNNNNNNSINQ